MRTTDYTQNYTFIKNSWFWVLVKTITKVIAYGNELNLFSDKIKFFAHKIVGSFYKQCTLITPLIADSPNFENISFAVLHAAHSSWTNISWVIALCVTSYMGMCYATLLYPKSINYITTPYETSALAVLVNNLLYIAYIDAYCMEEIYMCYLFIKACYWEIGASLIILKNFTKFTLSS